MDMNEKESRRCFLTKVAAVGAGGLMASQKASPVSAESVPTKGESPWQIGCYTRPWDKHDYHIALDAIAEAGFKYAGLMTTKSESHLVISVKYAGLMTTKSESHLVISVETTVEEAQKIGEECKERGLAVPSVYGGGIPVAESLEKGIEGLKRLIDNCAAAFCSEITPRTCSLMGGIGEKELHAPYYKAIVRSVATTQTRRVLESVSNLTKAVSMPLVPSAERRSRWWATRTSASGTTLATCFYYSDGKLDPVEDAATVDGLVVGIQNTPRSASSYRCLKCASRTISPRRRSC